MQPVDATQLGKLVGAAHITHFRIGLQKSSEIYYRNVEAFATASGARPMLLTDCKPPVGINAATTPVDLLSFNEMIGNTADAIEGVNEPDTRMSRDANWSADLDSCESSISSVLPLPFVAPAMAQAASYAHVGEIPGMDVANVHRYFSGHNPGTSGFGPTHTSCGYYDSIGYLTCLADGEVGNAGKPIYVTETGWNSVSEVDPATQGKYSAREILYDFANGVSRTYFYTLVGYVGSDGFGGCGLLNVNRSPKPAYYAIKTLLNAIADDGASYTPHQTVFSVSGVTSSVMTVPMQKHDGTNILAIWNETLSFDTSTSSEIKVASQQAAITIPPGQRLSSVITIGDSGLPTTPITTSANSRIYVPIDDHVTLVTFK